MTDGQFSPFLSYPPQLNQKTNQQRFEDAIDILESTPYELLPDELKEKIEAEIVVNKFEPE